MVLPTAPGVSLPLLGAVLVRILRIPYETSFVASERMGLFAALSLAESALTVASALAIGLLPWADPLSAYAALHLASAACAGAVVMAVSVRRHPLAWTRPCFRPPALRDLVGFFSWNSLGSVAVLLKGSGVMMLLAAYAGTADCAANEAAAQVTTLLWGLVANYRTAYLPGVVKAWADGQRTALVACTARAFRLSAAGMAIVTLPLFAWASPICRAWLGADAPPATPLFLRMVALQFLFEALATPLDTAILATGRIAQYEIVLTAILGSSFALAWAFLAAGLPGWTSEGAVALVNAFAFAYRLVYLKAHQRVAIRAWFSRCAA